MKCGCGPREWRGCTSGGRPLLAEGSATVTAGMTSAPRSSVSLTHRWSRMRSSSRPDRRGGFITLRAPDDKKEMANEAQE